MIPESFVQDLLARIDIVELIERYVPLKKGGANYLACCPFHNEKSPSFTVSPSKQFYHCFGCGAHGTAIGFLMEYSGLSFVDTIKELAQTIGLPVPETHSIKPEARARSQSLLDIMSQAAQFYRERLKHSPRAIDYLKRRGLTGEIAARYGIGYAPDGWQNLQTIFPRYDDPVLKEAGLVIENDNGKRYDRFRDRIMFPILDQRGNAIAFGGRIIDTGEPKYLNSPETPLFEKGRELYGLTQAKQALRDSSAVLVVEGYMDVVALSQFGLDNAVATLGTATTPHHVQKLLRHADRVVFCFDGDNAGRKAAHRALEASLAPLADDKTIAFLFLPNEHDPDSYVREHGSESFRKAMQQAMPLTEFLLQTLKTDCDLANAEGRAKLIHDAKEWIPKVGAPVLRLQLIRELSSLSQLSVDEVEKSLGLQPSRRGKTAPRAQPRAGVTSPLQKLLRLLMHHHELCRQVPIDLVAAQPASAERDALQALIDLEADEPATLSPANLYERFRNTSHEPVFSKLLVPNDEDFSHPDELAGSIRALQLTERTRQYDRLMQLIGERELNAEEKLQYKQILTEIQQLKSGHDL